MCVCVRDVVCGQDHVEPTLAKRDPKDKRVYAIVGAGAAGMAAAETLRQEGFTVSQLTAIERREEYAMCLQPRVDVRVCLCV